MCGRFQLFWNASAVAFSKVSIAFSTFFGALGGGQFEVECSLEIKIFFLTGNLTYLSLIERRHLSESIGILSFLGLRETPKLRLSPSVSRRSFDIDVGLVHRLCTLIEIVWLSW
jgi:hypothetical protein